MSVTRIRVKERDAIIQSLKSGVTPRIGIQHIQVGRVNEITALHQDIERIADGGASFRLIIGEYGSGKTFFLSVVRSIGLEKKLVSVSADLSPDRRIHSSGGQARNLYSELMKNMSTRNKPDGNALLSVVERFVTEARKEADTDGSEVSSVIHKRLAALSDMVGGYDFAKVIDAFWRGHEQDNETLKSNAIRWLRGEYTTKTDARNDLDVRTIITDASFYDSLKLMSLFVRQAGYAGILARLADVVAALIVRGWVACGCGNATGWVQVLRDPRLAKAIYAMHQRPGVNWKVEDLAREAGLSRSLFAERFLAATGTTPARYLTELRMRLAVQYITHEGQALEKVAFSLGYQSLAAFSRAFKRITGQPPGALRATVR